MDFRPCFLDRSVSLLLGPEIDPVDLAMGKPERPLMGVITVLAGQRLHRVSPRVRTAGQANQGEEERLELQYRSGISKPSSDPSEPRCSLPSVRGQTLPGSSGTEEERGRNLYAPWTGTEGSTPAQPSLSRLTENLGDTIGPGTPGISSTSSPAGSDELTSTRIGSSPAPDLAVRTINCQRSAIAVETVKASVTTHCQSHEPRERRPDSCCERSATTESDAASGQRMPFPDYVTRPRTRSDPVWRLLPTSCFLSSPKSRTG